jgi:hypothetical protein
MIVNSDNAHECNTNEHNALLQRKTILIVNMKCTVKCVTHETIKLMNQ